MLLLHVKSHSWSLSRFFNRKHTDLADTVLVVPDLHEAVFSYSIHIFWDGQFSVKDGKCCSRRKLIYFGF